MYERIQIVNIYGSSLDSSPLEILSGVPQRSFTKLSHLSDFTFLANYDKAISNFNSDISNIIKNAGNYYLVIEGLYELNTGLLIIGSFSPISLKKQCVQDFFSDTLPMLLAIYGPSLDTEEEQHVPAIQNSC